MPKTIVDTAPTDATNDGGNFATMPKDISNVTFVFDITPNNHEDSNFATVKVETPGSVNDDLDSWYDHALSEIVARNAQLAGAEVSGVFIKFGSEHGQSGGEFYYAIDHDSTNIDSAPISTGHADITYSYGSLFS
ncbi:MAG TPA: hypothetical protein VF495_08970 [Phenylobacterium sp.]